MARKKVNTKCKTCKYRTYINGTLACQYILIAEHSRGCPASKCDKYEKETHRKKIPIYFGD